jgi:type IV pilus assembly protein PilE
MRQSQGFTLIELMIVVAIIAIIALIAMSSYSEQIRKSRRAEAARFAGELQLDLERWRAENPSYVACTPTPCGSGTYPTPPSNTVSPYYVLAIDGANTNASNYRVTATPRSGSAQFGDKCGVLTLDRATNQGKPTWANAACNN